MKLFKTLALLISVALLLVVVGCGDEEGEPVAEGEWTGQTYKLAVNPFMEKDLLLKEWQPIADYLSEATGATFEVVIADDMEAHIALINNGAVDFATQNPLATAKMLGNATVILRHLTKVKTCSVTDKMRGTFISWRESEDKPALVATIGNIPGHSVAIVSYKASAGYLSQMLRLQEEGIDTSEVEFIVAGNNEDVIRAVYNGEADAGFIRESTWGCIDNELEYPGLIADIGKGAWVPNWAVVAHNNLPADFVEVVKAVLLELTKESECLVTCSRVESFIEADDSEYAPFKDF